MSARPRAYCRKRLSDWHPDEAKADAKGEPHGDGLSPQPLGPCPTYTQLSGHGRCKTSASKIDVTHEAGNVGVISGTPTMSASSRRSSTITGSPDGIVAANALARGGLDDQRGAIHNGGTPKCYVGFQHAAPMLIVQSHCHAYCV